MNIKMTNVMNKVLFFAAMLTCMILSVSCKNAVKGRVESIDEANLTPNLIDLFSLCENIYDNTDSIFLINSKFECIYSGIDDELFCPCWVWACDLSSKDESKDSHFYKTKQYLKIQKGYGGYICEVRLFSKDMRDAIIRNLTADHRFFPEFGGGYYGDEYGKSLYVETVENDDSSVYYIFTTFNYALYEMYKAPKYDVIDIIRKKNNGVQFRSEFFGKPIRMVGTLTEISSDGTEIRLEDLHTEYTSLSIEIEGTLSGYEVDFSKYNLPQDVMIYGIVRDASDTFQTITLSDFTIVE